MVLMKIKRSPAVQAHLQLVNSMKSELLRMVKQRIGVAKRLKKSTTELQNLYEELNAVSELFGISTKNLPYDKVDRFSSMLSGPFFVSKKYPVPVVDSREMFPVVQFDLAVLSQALEDDIGSGLFQLWFDVSSARKLIRIIPANALTTEELIDYQVLPLELDDAFPLPSWVELDPATNGVSVVQQLISRGIQPQTHFVDCYFDVFKDEDDLLIKPLMDFGEIKNKRESGECCIGGTLYGIQYNYTDVKMRQLIKLADWGSSGSAEVFFRSQKGKPTEYSFWSCVR